MLSIFKSAFMPYKVTCFMLYIDFYERNKTWVFYAYVRCKVLIFTRKKSNHFYAYGGVCETRGNLGFIFYPLNLFLFIKNKYN